jgi:hypothetical protein
MATLQDLLELEGTEVFLGELIVQTPQGRQIAGIVLRDGSGGPDTVNLNEYGLGLAAQLDGTAPADGTALKKRRRAAAPVDAVETPAEGA